MTRDTSEDESRLTPLQRESEPSERAAEAIAAWERKHAAAAAGAHDEVGDDAEAGGP